MQSEVGQLTANESQLSPPPFLFRKTVFLEEQDYLYYLANLREWTEVLAIKVYAWCLMTNYVHLIVEPGSRLELISLRMKQLAGRQRWYVNKECKV